MNKVLVALLCSVCILIVISSAQESYAVLVEPIINSPASNTEQHSPRHVFNITVPDGLEGFRETAVFAVINERTGQIGERRIASEGTFDVTVDTAFLVTTLGIIPETDSYAVEVFSRDSVSGEESAHNAITGLTIAQPSPPSINNPVDNEAVISPRFLVSVIGPPDATTNEDKFLVLKNPQTLDTFTIFLGSAENPTTPLFDIEVVSLINRINFDPKLDQFTLEAFVRDRVTNFESVRASVTGLTIAPPSPTPIITSPSPGDVLIPPRFTFTGDSDVNVNPENLFYAFTNPQTQVTFEVLTAINGPFQLELETIAVINRINLGPFDPFTLELFIRDKITGLESEHATVEGLTILTEGCPLPNGSTTTIFGGVIVAQENQPPMASFTITGLKTSQLTTVDASGSTDFDQPTDRPLEFMWEGTDPDGKPLIFDNPMAKITTFRPTMVGFHTVFLTVTDVCGASDTMGQSFGIENNKPPFADAGEDQNVPPGTVILDGRDSSDPDGDDSALGFVWDIIDDPPNTPTPTLVNPNTPTPSFEASVSGDYTIELTVNDPEGSFDSDEVIITINRPPMAVAVAIPDMIIPNQNSILDGSGSSDPDGDPIDHLWEIIKKPDGVTPVRDIVNPNSEMAMFSQGPNDLGQYQVQLTVFDNTETEDSAMVTITVIANTPPTVSIGQTKTTFVQGEAGVISATADDGEGNDISNQIDWRIRDRDSGVTLFELMDSNFISTQNLPVGTFRVEVKIEDSGGLMDTDFRNIEIVPTENKKSTNVPTGLGGSVNQQVGLNGINSINFGFDEVVQEGTIETLLGQLGPTPPNGFTIVSLGFGPQTYLNLSFDGSFTGNVEVCVNYDDSGLGLSEEQSFHMQHFNENPGLWEDITKNLDTVLNNICGQTDTLSPLAIMSTLVVGGELIPVDTTSLLLAGTHSNAAWMIPVLVSAIGIGLVFVRRK